MSSLEEESEWTHYLDKQLEAHRAEYAGIIRNQPSLCAARLRDLFTSDDPGTVAFLVFFFVNLKSLRSQEKIEIYWLSGFPQALLHVLSDHKWYDILKVIIEPNASEPNISTVSVAWQFSMAIKCLVIFTHPKNLLTAPTTTKKQLWEFFPVFWEVLWQYRRVVFSDELENMTRESKTDIAEIRNVYYSLFQKILGAESIPPLSTYVGHISFLLWFSYTPPASTEDDLPEYLGSGVIVLDQMLQAEVDTDRANGPSHVNAFLREVLPAVVGSTTVAEVIRRSFNLRGRPLLDSRTYMHTLNIISSIQTYGPLAEDPRRRAQDLRRTMSEITIAARHYECFGYAQGQNEKNKGEIATAFLAVATDCCITVNGSYAPEDVVLKLTVTDFFAWNPYDYHFVGLVSQSVGYAYTTDHVCSQEVVKMFVRAYTEFGSICKVRLPSKGNIHQRYHYVRRVLQVHWLPVLANLRMSLRREPHSAKLRASLQDFMNQWKKLGHVYSLSEWNEEDKSGLEDYSTPEEKLLGCFFAECPCYGHAPLHGYRRVCTGCWAVYYCGKQCQKKDWIKNHKVLCNGRSEPT